MKVLLVRMTSAIGGAEIYNLNLIKGFKKYYPEEEFYCLTNLSEFAERIKKVSGIVFTLPVFHEEVGTKRGLGRLILHLPKYLFYFGKEMLNLRIKEKIKLVILQGTTEKIVLTPLLRLLKLRVIWLEHGPFFSFNRASVILVLYRLNSHFVSQIITVSQNARQDLVKGGIEKNKVICLPTGVNTEYFFPLPAKQRQELIIGYVGAICTEKGVAEFIEIGTQIRRRWGIVKFVLVGNNSLKKKINDFVFTGFKEDVRPYLGCFSIFFFPTYHLEGLSLAVMEAMAMGVPVVARDIGGNRELVLQGRTGYLFKIESPKEIADLLVSLLQDRKKRERMGNSSRERIEQHFNYLKWVKEWQKIIEG